MRELQELSLHTNKLTGEERVKSGFRAMSTHIPEVF